MMPNKIAIPNKACRDNGHILAPHHPRLGVYRPRRFIGRKASDPELQNGNFTLFHSNQIITQTQYL